MKKERSLKKRTVGKYDRSLGKKNKEITFKWYRERIDNQIYDAFQNPITKIYKVGFG
jgi:hypothetical protein